MEEYDLVLRLLGENQGCKEVRTDNVLRVYYDTDDIFKIKYIDGCIGLLNDVDAKMIHRILEKWAADNPEKMKIIAIEMALGKPAPAIKHWTAKDNKNIF